MDKLQQIKESHVKTFNKIFEIKLSRFQVNMDNIEAANPQKISYWKEYNQCKIDELRRFNKIFHRLKRRKLVTEEILSDLEMIIQMVKEI